MKILSKWLKSIFKNDIFQPLRLKSALSNFFGYNHYKYPSEIVKYSHFGAGTTPQSWVKVCNFWPHFWPIFGDFWHFFLAQNINLGIYFHIKSSLDVKIDPRCLRLSSNTPYSTSFMLFFRGWFSDPGLCYALCFCGVEGKYPVDFPAVP